VLYQQQTWERKCMKGMASFPGRTQNCENHKRRTYRARLGKSYSSSKSGTLFPGREGLTFQNTLNYPNSEFERYPPDSLHAKNVEPPA
jgi:hypothetical protein